MKNKVNACILIAFALAGIIKLQSIEAAAAAKPGTFAPTSRSLTTTTNPMLDTKHAEESKEFREEENEEPGIVIHAPPAQVVNVDPLIATLTDIVTSIIGDHSASNLMSQAQAILQFIPEFEAVYANINAQNPDSFTQRTTLPITEGVAPGELLEKELLIRSFRSRINNLKAVTPNLIDDVSLNPAEHPEANISESIEDVMKQLLFAIENLNQYKAAMQG